MELIGRKGEQRAIRSKQTAGGRLVGRRDFLARSIALTGGALAGGSLVEAAEPSTPEASPWQRVPGQPVRAYGQPSRFEEVTQRSPFQPFGAIAPALDRRSLPCNPSTESSRRTACTSSVTTTACLRSILHSIGCSSTA